MKLLLSIILLILLAMTSCLKDEDKTFVLFGEEGYVQKFDSIFGLPIDTILSSGDTLSVLLRLREGINTPDIRGEFEFADRRLVYPAGAFAHPNDKVYFRFGDGKVGGDQLHGQHHLIVHCDIKIPGLSLDSELFRTDTAYVMGSGNRFVVYLQRAQEVHAPYGDREVRYKLTQGIAISGKRESGTSDIVNARLALYNKKIEFLNASEFGNEVIQPIAALQGQLYVFKDSNDTTRYNTSEQPYINWNE